jgi:O-antigen/teichoic acid export membrane protein
MAPPAARRVVTGSSPLPAAGDAGPDGGPAGGRRDESGDNAKQVRGSSLLLLGRFIGVGLAFLAQVVLVRAFSREDFGAFAFALAVVSLGAVIAASGLDKALSRFVPMYEEQGQLPRAVGAVVLAVLIMGGLSVVVMAGTLVLAGMFADEIDPTAFGLLAIMVLLLPVQAFDALVTALFAVLASPRSIFVRRYLMAPGLQLLVLAVVVPLGLGITSVAIGYVAAGLFGVGIYGLLLLRLMRRRWGGAVTARPPIPGREVLGYSLPLLSSDLVFLLRGHLVVVLLGWYGTNVDVATFWAVFPLARLILIVFQSFMYLFLPQAARLVARNDLPGLGRLHWQGMAWIALFSFPMFAAPFALAEPLSVLFFGGDYAESGPVLALLALGFFVTGVTAMNGLVLRALGMVRTLVVIDLLTAAVSVITYVLLIPPLGAVGAALGMLLTSVGQGAAYQVSVLRSGVPGPGVRQVAPYPVLAILAAGLLAMQVIVAPPVWVSLPIVGLVALVALLLHRDVLQIATTFPELARLPLVGRLLGSPGTGSPRP